jgi:pyruvate/2-oxoglutarate dehydrogenase complex dihydrolipoamide dehydrogenase (E3) component
MSGDHNQFQKGKSYLDEPVAWMHTTGTGHRYFRKKPQDKVFNPQPVYTSPKREWVGLTDEEIYEYADKYLYQHGSNYGIKAFGKAIEAKLKEKNHG